MGITWTKQWAASDNGAILSGADLGRIQRDIDAGFAGNATSIQDKPVDAPTSADDEKLLYYDHDTQTFKLKVVDWTVPGTIGSATPNTGKFTTLEATTSLKLGLTVTSLSSDGTLVGNSDSNVPTQKAVKTYVDGRAITITNLSWAVGDVLLASADTERTTSSGTPAKLKEIVVYAAGALRIKFHLQTSVNDEYVRAQVYRNGSAVGTLQQATSDVGGVFSEDISGWSVGDLCQLYAFKVGSGNAIAKDFRLYGAASLSFVIATD